MPERDQLQPPPESRAVLWSLFVSEWLASLKNWLVAVKNGCQSEIPYRVATKYP